MFHKIMDDIRRAPTWVWIGLAIAGATLAVAWWQARHAANSGTSGTAGTGTSTGTVDAGTAQDQYLQDLINQYGTLIQQLEQQNQQNQPPSTNPTPGPPYGFPINPIGPVQGGHWPFQPKMPKDPNPTPGQAVAAVSPYHTLPGTGADALHGALAQAQTPAALRGLPNGLPALRRRY